MNYLVAVGFRGKLDQLGVTSLETYEEKDTQVRNGEIAGFAPLTPLVESNPRMEPIYIESDETDLTNQVEKEYSNLCDPESTNPNTFSPGPFGDFIQVYKTADGYLMNVGQKAFPKPGLAVDLGIVIQGRNKTEKVSYLVTGVRKADPGKGKPAWIGGFRDLKKGPDGIYVFDSSIYTLLHEAREEAGLRIEHEDPESLRKNYTIDTTPVTVNLGEGDSKIEAKANIHYLDTLATSDTTPSLGGETLSDGSKRVYATDGYLLLIDLENTEIGDEQLYEWLTAGDDIGDLQFHNITPFIENRDVEGLTKELDFGIEHHKNFVPHIVNKMFRYNSKPEQELYGGC